MKSTDPEPHGVGMELEQYRTRLEQMVEEKSKDLIAIQENLEATNRRQALFIKGIANSATGTGHTYCYEYGIGEIGRYTGVDRLATWGKPPRWSYVWLYLRMVQRRYRTRYRLPAEYDY